MTQITIAFRQGAGSSSTLAWARNDSVAVPPAGTVYSNLLDVNGVATGVSLSCSAAFSGQGGNTAYATAGAGGWPEDVFERHTFLAANNTRTLTFSGLPANTDVTLEIAGHRGASATRDLYFTWGGNSGFWDQSGNTTPNAPASVVGTTNSSGVIALVVQSTTTNDTTYVNGMRLTYDGGSSAIVFDYYVADADHNSARIATRAPAGGAVAIEYSVNSDFSSSTTTSTITANSGNNYTVQIPISGLAANTVYYYRGILGGNADNTLGAVTPKFKTAPAGAANLKFVLSSCANTGSAADVFGRIRARNADVFIHHGDLHYEDIATEDLAAKRAAYLSVLTSSEQNKLYKQVVLWYRYDDHDYGANNSDATNAGKVSSAAALREMFPQQRVNSSGAVYATAKRGRVRFIQLDVRYEKASNTLLGSTQLSWFLSELSTAADDIAAGTIALVIVDVSVPWIATAATDSWSDATAERTTISDHIFSEGLQDNIVFVAGDMHGTAYDDGTNNTFATGGAAGWPVIQSGSLDRPVSTKGGPYTNGPYATNTGQYTVMDVVDTGSQITVNLTGYTTGDTVLYTASFATPFTGIVAPLLINEQTFFGAVVTPGVVNVTAPLLTNDQEFYGAVVTPGEVSFSAPLLTNNQTFFGGIVSADEISIAAPLLVNEQTFFGAVVTPGAVNVSAPLLTNDQQFFSAVVTPGEVNFSVPLLTNNQTFFGVIVSADAITFAAPLLVNTQTFFGGEVIPGTVNLTAPFLTNNQQFFGGQITGGEQVAWFQNPYLTVYYKPKSRTVKAVPKNRTVKFRF